MNPASSPVSVRIRTEQEVRRVDSPTEAFSAGPWLVVVPHDDDLVVGMGLLLAAVAEQIEVHIAVVTDGAMGYDWPQQQASTVKVRSDELRRAAETLGVTVERIHRLGFPDGALTDHQGCRPPAEPPGVAQRLVGLVRRVRPTTVWTCAPSDYHPDHRTTASEVDIAGFWASHQIWLELGEPVSLPVRWDYPVYCAFDGPPDAEVRGTDALLEQKLAALACFESQGVLAPIIEEVKQAGPVEYFQRTTQTPYRPANYRGLFG